MSNSRERVLNTPELLEEILGFLDVRTLLTSVQLVNHEWHSLVTHSPALQRALYFRPDETKRPNSARACDDDEVDFGLNPLLAEVFPGFFQPFRPDPLDTSSSSSASASTQQQQQQQRHLGPHERGTHTTHHGKRDARALPTITKSTFTTLPWAAADADPARAEALMRHGASWRRMLVRQPPAARLGRCHRYVGGYHGDVHCEYDTLDLAAAGGGGGLRMGELYDLVLDWTARVPGARGCGVFWAPDAFLDVLRATPGVRPAAAGRPLTALARDMIEAREAMTRCVEVVVEVVECVPPGEEDFVLSPSEAARERDEFERRFRHPEAKELLAF